MDIDKRLVWYVKEITVGEVTIRDAGADCIYNHRVDARATAVAINRCGSSETIRADGRAFFDAVDQAGEAVTLALHAARTCAQLAVKAFCEVENAELQSRAAQVS